MVFKRRTRRSFWGWARQLVYPEGGFARAIRYVMHRMRRLPDEPHRIARGVFAGTFVNFPPIFGLQFVSAALLAYVMRGNIIAALLSTFLSNPITTPFIAVGSLQLGHWMLGTHEPLSAVIIFDAFSDAGLEIWRNIRAIFTSDPVQWGNLDHFWRAIYLPYLVGSILPGLVTALIFYYATVPLIGAYQKLRSLRLRDRVEKHKRQRAASKEPAQGAGTGTEDPSE